MKQSKVEEFKKSTHSSSYHGFFGSLWQVAKGYRVQRFRGMSFVELYETNPEIFGDLKNRKNDISRLCKKIPSQESI